MKALIGICAEGDIQKEFDGLVRNKEMYKNLASDLQEEQGYDRDWKKYESKIKTEYRTEKETTTKQGGVGKQPCITMIWIETWSSPSSEATICTESISWRAVSRT